MGFPHLGQFMLSSLPIMKTKTPLSLQRDKGVNLCGTTLLAGGHKTPAAQACPVTGASGGAYCFFRPSAPRGSSPRPPDRLAPNGGSLCVLEAGTLPFPRKITICFLIISSFPGVVKTFSRSSRQKLKQSSKKRESAKADSRCKTNGCSAAISR